MMMMMMMNDDDYKGAVQFTTEKKEFCGRSGLVAARLPCARGPRFESRCGQKFAFSRKSVRYAAFGTGCTLTAVPMSTQPSILRGTVNEYQPYG